MLFSTLNCLACHTAPDAAPANNDANAAPAAADAGNAQGQDQGESADVTLASVRVPLRYVKAKFTPAGLKEYLLNPHAHYAWNPMPNFRLSAGGGGRADGVPAGEQRRKDRIRPATSPQGTRKRASSSSNRPAA